MPDVCSVSAAQAEQGGPRTSLSVIRIKQCKENMCFFGKLLKVVLLALAGEGRENDEGRFSGEQVFLHSTHMGIEEGEKSDVFTAF